MDERGKAKRTDMAHNVILEGRGRLSISGVEDVPGFDDGQIDAYTSRGMLTVRGANLRIESLNLETGELMVDGTVDALIYSDGVQNSGGFFSKLFK